MANPVSFPTEALQQLIVLTRDLAPRAGEARSIAVTSALVDEGVSSTVHAWACNLARVHQQRVLLVDANLHRPSLHELVQRQRAPGLADLLVDGGDEWSAHRQKLGEGFEFIGAGRPLEHPARYLETGEIRAALTRLGGSFDWVVFDCPAVNVYPDTPSIAAACTSSVLVVRSGRTRREVVLEAKRRLEQAGAEIAGVVLNRRRYYIPERLYRWL